MKGLNVGLGEGQGEGLESRYCWGIRAHPNRNRSRHTCYARTFVLCWKRSGEVLVSCERKCANVYEMFLFLHLCYCFTLCKEIFP